MKLSPDSSASDTSGRTDHQEFPETFRRIDRIRALLVADPANTPECRLGWSVVPGNLRGIRGLEQASGLHHDQAWEMTSPLEGGLSPLGLVRTVERGKSWDSEGRLKGEYAFGESVRVPDTKNTLSKNPPTPQGDQTLKGLEDLDGYRVRYAHRFSDRAVMALANPALDIWRGKDKTALGSEGWRVGIILGFDTVELSAKEWAALAGGTDRAKRLAKKLEAWNVLKRVGSARATRYVLDWTDWLDRANEEPEAMGCRKSDLEWRHAREQLRIQRPPSPEELEIRRRGKKPAQFAAYLQDALDEAESPEHRKDLEQLLHHLAGATEAEWRGWFDAGRSLTEGEVYELAGLTKPEKPKQPTPEELAAMVRRITKEPEMPKVPDVLPATQPAQAEGESEDDFRLRTVCKGDPRLFESVFGRLPNQEAVVDARTQARIDKARRRRERASRVATPS
ncbi:hypothetical protein ACFW2D_10080 [Streptomyces sp. NPDC058914]|uniref:hypothetical protein n=1 Tax=Streptomyces sp. NPDC058914 TaxID=3346671 RepID=UPI0036A18AD7